jgi:hypothetical protein
MLFVLAVMFWLAGCSSTLTTRTVETETAIVADVCRAWLPITYSSRDTDQTQLEVRAGNAAREAYCMEP